MLKLIPQMSAVCVIAAATSAAPVPGEAQAAFAEACVVEVADLAAFMESADTGLVILDVRPEDEYAAGHLPGAFRVSYEMWESLSLEEETGLTHEDQWAARFGLNGIDGDDAVLVYDGGKMTQAARVWFILQHFGVARVAVINGGFPLIAQGTLAGQTPALATEPQTASPKVFTPSAQPGRIDATDRHAVLAMIEQGRAQVLDARTTAEYTGEDLRKNARGGHLPTAISLPHTDLLDDQQRLLPAAELAARLEKAGFVKGKPIITHCDGGGRAALAALAAARAGYGPVINYYLSFGDWAKDAACPVVQE